jgi:hypothetical protein
MGSLSKPYYWSDANDASVVFFLDALPGLQRTLPSDDISLIGLADGVAMAGEASIIDLEAYRNRRQARGGAARPVSTPVSLSVLPVGFYWFWPAVVWVPVPLGAVMSAWDRG